MSGGIRDFSPFFIALDQWRRQALQLCTQLKTRELSAYEKLLVAEVEAHADEEWPSPEPGPPFDDVWVDPDWRDW